ncbi:MAG TPA: trypsin-like peptidase domain-containing protein [Phycisphaerae bacterium]|nr:trypsin-like peptidase domain-containing protein [Phycisphaerae bacterium]
MIFVRCPRCGRTFGTPEVPEDGLARCTICNQALRLRAKRAEALPSARSILPRWLRRPSRQLMLFLVLAVVVGAGLVIARKYGRRREEPARRPVSSAPVLKGRWEVKTAFESQQALRRTHQPVAAMRPDEVFAVVSPAVVRVIVRNADGQQIGQGSGFVVSKDGWVVTNYHVIRAGSSATVVTESYIELPVQGAAAVDRAGDLALLKTGGEDLRCLLVSEKLSPRVGTKVYAIGSPRGLANSFSEGLISGHRVENGVPVLQTTASMGQGSSGGPLLTEDGRVVGVNSRIRAGGQNLNFAIPAERIRDLLLQQGQVVPLAKLGGTDIPKDVIGRLDKAWTAMDESEWDQARNVLTPLAQAYPQSPHVWLALGYLNRRTALYKPAVEAFEAALKLKADYAEAYYGMGMTYLDQLSLAEIIRDHAQTREFAFQAREALSKAAGLDPGGRVGRMARASLRQYWPKDYPNGSEEEPSPDVP